jgi:hypothetical protein
MGYRYDSAEAEDDFGMSKSRAPQPFAQPAIDRASEKLDAIYAIVTDGDAPALDDLEAAAQRDPLNMARRYSAIVDILTGSRRR